MKRISGGRTSVGADAKLLSSHAGDPRAATGDKTNASQAGQLIRPVSSVVWSQPVAGPRNYRPCRTSPARKPHADTEVWFVVDAVAEMDLEGFYAPYGEDGLGRPVLIPPDSKPAQGQHQAGLGWRALRLHAPSVSHRARR